MMKFCTGLDILPPIGLEPITIEYLPLGHVLPSAAACISLVRLPMDHNTFQDFEKRMDQGILGSLDYYGLLLWTVIGRLHFYLHNCL